MRWDQYRKTRFVSSGLLRSTVGAFLQIHSFCNAARLMKKSN